MKAPSLLLIALLAIMVSECFGYEPAAANPDNSAAPIINGVPATSGAQPWAAALLRKSTNPSLAPSQLKFCGGSLIAPGWVLTAAHCVNSLVADKVQVRLGLDNLDASGGEMLQVSQIVVNPRYDETRQYADIALLRLSRPASVLPIALPSARDASAFTGLTGTIFGWGSTNGLRTLPCTLQFTSVTPANTNDYFCKTFVYRTPGQSKVLLAASATLLDRPTCNRRFIAALKELGVDTTGITLIADIYPSTLCVADIVNKSATCYGDSGGPLVINTQGRSVLAGITSFGIGLSCQGQNQINFYTEVADYLDFITQATTSEQQLDFDHLCPATMAPLRAEVGAVQAGVATVKLSWDVAARATGYSLIYTSLPRRGDGVSRADMSAESHELVVSLGAGTRYLISVQAKGSACDGGVSKPTEVRVP